MLHRDIHIDFNGIFSFTGIDDTRLESLAPQWLEVHRALVAMQEMGQLQFLNLPYLESLTLEIQPRVEKFRQKFDTLVVLGIGGAGLGAKAICEAALRDSTSSGRRSCYFLDTIDPDSLSRFFENLIPERTLFNVVSKSGNTVETMAQFLLLHDFLRRRLGESKFREHIVMTTDAKKGTLRKLCSEQGFESFEILPGLGGRFSVLSPVGFFPAAFLGIPVEEIVRGAGRMAQRCRLEDLWTNPAAMFAAVHYLLAKEQRKTQLVLFNYAQSMGAWSSWFCQLWAESLGKRFDLSGAEIRSGMTPLLALGPRDQHSQLQLFLEGPQDKAFLFLEQEKYGAELAVPKAELAELAYLSGKPFGEILHAEIAATELALQESGAPTMRMSFWGADPYSLGQMFFLSQMAVAYSGGLLNVNPYNHPGVEVMKRYLYGALGRPDYEVFGQRLFSKIKNKKYVV